jgi:fumarate reductase subunit C
MSRKPFVRAVSPTRWYFKHPRYLRYMSREITCVFIGALALVMLCALAHLARGPESYAAFLAGLQTPGMGLLLLAILIFAVHNATSWFNVTPKAMPVQIGEEFVPGRIVVAAHYALWIAVSLVVAYLAGVR